MNILLRVKHWQLFILLWGIPLINQIALLTDLISSKSLNLLFTGFPLITALFMAFYFGWIYSIASGLNSKLPGSVKMNLTKFKIFIIIPFAYMLFLSIYIFTFFKDYYGGQQPGISLLALLIPIHLFSMFCIFYCFYFTAKSLRSVELGRPVVFDDYAGEFFLFWFFPIGVWILQPRINKLFALKR